MATGWLDESLLPSNNSSNAGLDEFDNNGLDEFDWPLINYLINVDWTID